jgi:hypothetical protein
VDEAQPGYRRRIQAEPLEFPKTGFFRQFGFTFPDSRFLGNLPKTQIDLNRSMSALACYRHPAINFQRMSKCW